VTTRGWVIAIAAVAGIGLGAWTMSREAPVPVADRAAIGQRPPDYVVRRLPKGDSLGLRAAFKNHVTLINLWATWCGPCREEMPSIERLYLAYRDRGFRVAAVSVDEGDEAAILTYGRDAGLTFDLFHDRSGRIQEVYRTIGLPQSFLLGRDGRVAYMAMGASEWDSPEMRLRVEQLLAQGR
jgi:cytochrome c biogenesis protein CcmG/thiol:disulfide interchange protein DsbE